MSLSNTTSRHAASASAHSRLRAALHGSGGLSQLGAMPSRALCLVSWHTAVSVARRNARPAGPARPGPHMWRVILGFLDADRDLPRAALSQCGAARAERAPPGRPAWPACDFSLAETAWHRRHRLAGTASTREGAYREPASARATCRHAFVTPRRTRHRDSPATPRGGRAMMKQADQGGHGGRPCQQAETCTEGGLPRPALHQNRIHNFIEKK